MSKQGKLLARLLSKPKDFEWSEALKLLSYYDYKLLTGSGSRRKFVHQQTKQVIILHQPHPGNILKEYIIKELITGLKEGGFISE